MTHGTLGPIPHKRVIPCDIVMLHGTKLISEAFVEGLTLMALLITRESSLVDSHIDLTCEMMVGTTIDASSSNYVVVKFVKFLNNVRLANIAANTFQTPIAKSMDCPLPSSISM
jgi:hypothetical protein